MTEPTGETVADRYRNVRFLMIVEGRRSWMTFRDCYRTLDAGFMQVTDGGLALDVSGTGVERPLTEQEKHDITDAADEFSGSK